MEIIKKMYIVLIALSFLSCKKAPLETLSNNKLEVSNKIPNSTFQKIDYINREIVNGIFVFKFKDKTITLEYETSTLLGISDNHNFKIFSSQYDLDLGEVNLHRFDSKNSQIYIVELKDYDYITYNLYFVENNQVYYLGVKDIDLSNQFNDKNNSLKIEINNKENIISMNLQINEKYFSKSDFKTKSLLKPLREYGKIEDYLGNNIFNDDSEDKNLITTAENEYFSINIDKNEVITVNSKKGKNKYINSNILEGNMNCPDTSIDEVILKNNYFTIQKYNCNDNFFLKEYITFRQDVKGVFLYKYGIEQTDKQNPDKVLPNKNYGVKDFGSVPFQEVDKEFLRSLMIK